MARVIAKVDSNQSAVVKTLRSVPGVSVLLLHQVGGGCPDLCVGYQGRNYLFELKNPSQVPSKQQLTEAEKEFAASWRGHVSTVTSAMEILNQII